MNMRKHLGQPGRRPQIGLLSSGYMNNPSSIGNIVLLLLLNANALQLSGDKQAAELKNV